MLRIFNLQIGFNIQIDCNIQIGFNVHIGWNVQIGCNDQIGCSVQTDWNVQIGWNVPIAKADYLALNPHNQISIVGDNIKHFKEIKLCKIEALKNCSSHKESIKFYYRYFESPTLDLWFYCDRCLRTLVCLGNRNCLVSESRSIIHLLRFAVCNLGRQLAACSLGNSAAHRNIPKLTKTTKPF